MPAPRESIASGGTYQAMTGQTGYIFIRLDFNSARSFSMPFPISRWRTSFAFALLLGAAGIALQFLYAAEAPVVIAPPKLDSPKAVHSTQTAVLAGGPVLGVPGAFWHVNGRRQDGSRYSCRESQGAD